MDFWKRTEEIEIDLADFMRRLCRQWKKIAVCALASALTLGGYGRMKQQDAQAGEMSVSLEEAELTESEEQEVADAVRLENEIKGLETYLDTSVLMQTDPYHKAGFTMLYCIDQAELQELPGITESYLNFISNGGAADMLKKNGSWEMDKSYLQELLSAYQRTYSLPYQIALDGLADSSKRAESLFYVGIAGKDAESARKIASDLQDVLEEYSAKVKKSAGIHKITMASSAESITADSGLQAQQRDKKALLSADRTNLKTMTDAFSKVQMTAYREAVGAENEEEEDVSVQTAPIRNTGFSMKYIFFGFLGGIFAYCGIFFCLYVFRDTVKSMDEIKKLYTFSVYGGISLKERDERKRKAITRPQNDVYKRERAQLVNRIRLSCQKQGITKLCAAADFPIRAQEKQCLKEITEQLKNWEIDMEVFENVIVDTAVWDRLAEIGNILLVFRMGTTTHRMVDDAMAFFLENDMTVTGAAVFLQAENR